MADASLKQIADFFLDAGSDGKRTGSLTDFSKEWKSLSEGDKSDLKQGIGDGSLTY